MSSETSENDNNNKEEKKLSDEWMIRHCDVYQEEYSDCRSIKDRFHQYFVHGETVDCSQWKRDFDNCTKWIDNKDIKAAKEIIQSEKNRRMERLKAHYGNKVWDKRKNPPEDWNKPLPKSLLDEYENSYLHIKSQELKGEIPPQLDLTMTIPSCTIL